MCVKIKKFEEFAPFARCVVQWRETFVFRIKHDLDNRAENIGSFVGFIFFKKSCLRDVMNVTLVKDKSSDYGS